MIAKFIENSSFDSSSANTMNEGYILQYLDEGLASNLEKLVASAKMKAKALKDRIKALPKLISKMKELFMKNLGIGLKKAFKEEHIDPEVYGTSYDEILKEINTKLMKKNAKMLNVGLVTESQDLHEFVEFATGIDWSLLQNSCSPEVYEFLVEWGDILIFSISSFLVEVLREIFGKKQDDYVVDALENPADKRIMATKIARKAISYAAKGFVSDVKNLVKNI